MATEKNSGSFSVRGHIGTKQELLSLLSGIDQYIPVFFVEIEISNFAGMLFREEVGEKTDTREMLTPSDSIRHEQATAIAFSCGEDLWELFFLDEPEGTDGRSESIVSANVGGVFKSVARYSAGGPICIINRDGFASYDIDIAVFNIVGQIAFSLSLINQPRIVKKSPAASRQVRRHMERGGAKAVDAWHMVTWDLSKSTVAKVTLDPSFHKVPLHWRRGHWRKAEEHYKGAVRRHDAIRQSERLAWWQWIEGVWVGHPAFGIKKSYHAPKLSSNLAA